MNGHDTSPTRPADQIILETKLKMTEKADPENFVQNSDPDVNRNEKTDSLEDSVDGNSKTTISTDVEKATKIAQMSFETLERELEENEVETSNSEAVVADQTPSGPVENANKSDDCAEKMDTEDGTLGNINDEMDNNPVVESADSAEISNLVSQTPVAEEKLNAAAQKSDSEKTDKSENMDNSVNDDAMDLFDLGEQVLEKYAKPESPKGDAPPIKLRIRRSAAEIRSEVVAEKSSSSSAAESPVKTSSLDSPAQTSSPRRRGRPPKKRPLDDEFVPTDNISPVKKRGPRGPYKKKNLNESSTSEVSDIENSQNVSPHQSPQLEPSTRPKRAAAEKAVREVIERSFELLEKEAFEFQPEPFFKKQQKKEREDKEALPEPPKSPEKRKRGRKAKKLAETHEKSFEELEKEAFEADRRKSEAVEEAAVKPVLTVPVVEEQPDQNVQYVPGDMLWSKVAGHPWWPSMVSYDPHKGKYTDMKQRGIRIYHVQYFGPDPERSWVTEKSTMRFLGLDGFEDALFRERKEKFKITPKRMPDWEFAVEEADDALKMTTSERKQQLTFVYEDPKKKKQMEREAAKADKVKAKVPHTPQKKNKISLEKVDKKLKESPNSEPADSELGEPFDRYVSEVLGPLREANPKLALDELQDLLEEGWRKLKPHERTKYQAVGDLPEKKRRKRSRKPSSKVREMEEDAEEEDVDVEAEDEEEEDAEEPPPVKPSKPRKRKPRDSAAPEDAPEPKKAKKEEKRQSEVERRKSESESEKKEEEATEKKKKRQKSPLTISDEQALEITKLSNSGPSKKESVCALCEEAGNGEMVVCSGQCLDSYHVACLGSEEIVDNFKCEQCTTGEHICFVCKVQEAGLQKCSVVQCGKFYHLSCVRSFSQTRVHKSFICPLHCCSSCFSDNPAGLKAFKGRLVKCLRCPSAYHTGDFCASAGSEPVAGFYIICPKHFVPKKSKSHHAHCNVSWCFQCSKGGILICCEACPGAYHSDCLEDPPSAKSGVSWFCPDCMRGREPMYGEIVWVKLGNYRWWPAEICHPKNVPDNVQDIAHQAGEFPVRFYGSKDYYWTHRGRIFQFQEGDQGGTNFDSAPRQFAALFRRAVVEATKAYQQWRKTKCDQEKQASDKKPAPFKFIKTNIAVGNVSVAKPDLSEIARCECKPDATNPCGPDSDCVNRMLWYECHPAQCPAGTACQNQRFQQRIYPEQSVFKTAKHGWGLKAMVDVKKGEFVNEYVGELIDEEECRRRIDRAHDENITNFYMLTIEKDRIIDAGPKGNYSRFMNHSCDPNCETQKWTINGEVRVGLFAKTDLSAGTELTFNYNLECLGDDKTVCECGSDNCSGYLGVRPKPNHSNGQKSSLKKKKRRKPKIKDDGHENECWRCGDGGDLVMCDRGSCPKAYHLSCLGLDKMPHGKWDCPWHHCDECGGRAERRCDECPNSFCLAHSTPDLVVEFPSKGRTLCTDHAELIEAYKSGKGTPEDSDASSVTSEQAKGEKSSNKKEAKEMTVTKSGKKKDSELGMGPVLQLPKGMSIKRTVNALLSSKHGKVVERGTPKGKKGRPSIASKKEEVRNQSESEDDEEIPGFKLKTTARRDMQKAKRTQSQKRKRTSTGQKEGKKKGPKPRKRARLGTGDGDDSDEFSESDLVIDA